MFMGYSPIILSQDQLVKVAEPLTDNIQRTQLAYIESYDAIAGFTYAYLAYLETDVNKSQSVIYISGNKTAEVKIDPNHSAFKRKCQQAALTPEGYFAHGFKISPRPSDSRNIEFRIHVNKLAQPTFVEMYVVTRKTDGTANTPVVEKIPWPIE
jgi:bifunctional ADP-heptose synthase (sugar kinase/adenylyltransferase)